MALTVIAHAADSETGVARVTYDHFCQATLLSRAKVSKDLDALEHIEVIEREPGGTRSTYKLANYDVAGGWAKFPSKSMYSSGTKHSTRQDQDCHKLSGGTLAGLCRTSSQHGESRWRCKLLSSRRRGGSQAHGNSGADVGQRRFCHAMRNFYANFSNRFCAGREKSRFLSALDAEPRKLQQKPARRECRA